MEHMEAAMQSQLEASMQYYEDLANEVLPIAKEHVERWAKAYHTAWSRAEKKNQDAVSQGHPPACEYPKLSTFIEQAILFTVRDLRMSSNDQTDPSAHADCGPVPGSASLANDVARCDGSSNVEDGVRYWREGCETCLRRTAPRPERVWMIAPPAIIAFECEYLIDPNARGDT